MQNYNLVNFALYEKARNAPVNSSCVQPTLPRVLTPMYVCNSIFFALVNSWGWRPLSCQILQGGDENRGPPPSSINTATFFINRTVG